MKKVWFIVLLVIISLALFWIFQNKTGQAENINSVVPLQENSVNLDASTEEIEDESSQLSAEDKQKYALVYQDPYVIHLRKALNEYVYGTDEGVEIAETTITASESERTKFGLDSFDRSYYESKFVVLSINPGSFGGVEVTIMFQDKPDKVFNAWMYRMGTEEEGIYDFRGFWKNPNFSDEDILKIQDEMGDYLTDTELSI